MEQRHCKWRECGLLSAIDDGVHLARSKHLLEPDERLSVGSIFANKAIDSESECAAKELELAVQSNKSANMNLRSSGGGGSGGGFRISIPVRTREQAGSIVKSELDTSTTNDATHNIAGELDERDGMKAEIEDISDERKRLQLKQSGNSKSKMRVKSRIGTQYTHQ